jgi:SAM-dependent methyltransferase
MDYFLFFIFFIIIATFAWGALLAAPWVPTLKKQRDLLVDHLDIQSSRQKLPPTTFTLYDLGCGSGSMLFAFADRYPHAKCIGYDVAILPLVLGWMQKFRHPKKYKNVSLRFGNFFTKHFSDADMVIAFLMQSAYPKFSSLLDRELKPNTFVAFEAWPLPDREPIQTIEGKNLTPWYVYQWSSVIRKEKS